MSCRRIANVASLISSSSRTNVAEYTINTPSASKAVINTNMMTSGSGLRRSVKRLAIGRARLNDTIGSSSVHGRSVGDS